MGARANKAKRKDLDRRERLRLWITVAVSSVLVLTIAVFAYFLPFRDLLPAVSIPKRNAGEMRVHFLDVGQGDATLIEFSDGNCILVDAGDSSYAHMEKLARYIRGIQPQSLTVVATHADADHCGGIADIIERFGAEKLYLPVVSANKGIYTRMIDAAERKGAEIETLTRYNTIVSDTGAYIVCVSPRSIDETRENDSSALLYLSYQGVNILLGADVTSTRERLIIHEYELDETIFDSGSCTVRLNEVDILRVSHHGSGGSSSEDWLRLLGADVAIFSCGQGNFYGHPAQDAVERLARNCKELYRTDELGDLIATISDDGYAVFTLDEYRT